MYTVGNNVISPLVVFDSVSSTPENLLNEIIQKLHQVSRTNSVSDLVSEVNTTKVMLDSLDKLTQQDDRNVKQVVSVCISIIESIFTNKIFV